MTRTTALRRFLCYFPAWILLLQLINLSVDLSGVKHQQQLSSHTAAPVSHHEIESLYEFIAEKVLQHSLPDSHTEGIDTEFHCFDIFCQRLPDTNLFIIPVSPGYLAHQEDGFTSYHPRLPSPPPDGIV
jgi:hypothetical protein